MADLGHRGDSGADRGLGRLPRLLGELIPARPRRDGRARRRRVPDRASVGRQPDRAPGSRKGSRRLATTLPAWAVCRHEESAVWSFSSGPWTLSRRVPGRDSGRIAHLGAKRDLSKENAVAGDVRTNETEIESESPIAAPAAAIADPGPLGLGAFAMTTFLLSCFNAGLAAKSLEAVVLPSRPVCPPMVSRRPRACSSWHGRSSPPT